MARRILRLSATFRRGVEALGVRAGSPAYRDVSSVMRALELGELPGAGDHETEFAPGRIWVRRVLTRNLWVLYRFDDRHVFVMTVRGEPPVPAE